MNVEIGLRKGLMVWCTGRIYPNSISKDRIGALGSLVFNLYLGGTITIHD